MYFFTALLLPKQTFAALSNDQLNHLLEKASPFFYEEKKAEAVPLANPAYESNEASASNEDHSSNLEHSKKEIKDFKDLNDHDAKTKIGNIFKDMGENITQLMDVYSQARNETRVGEEIIKSTEDPVIAAIKYIKVLKSQENEKKNNTFVPKSDEDAFSSNSLQTKNSYENFKSKKTKETKIEAKHLAAPKIAEAVHNSKRFSVKSSLTKSGILNATFKPLKIGFEGDIKIHGDSNENMNLTINGKQNSSCEIESTLNVDLNGKCKFDYKEGFSGNLDGSVKKSDKFECEISEESEAENIKETPNENASKNPPEVENLLDEVQDESKVKTKDKIDSPDLPEVESEINSDEVKEMLAEMLDEELVEDEIDNVAKKEELLCEIS